MQFITLVVLLAPLAQATVWNLQGSCSSKKARQYSGSENMGRLSCTPPDEEELAALGDDYGNSNWVTDDKGSFGGAQFVSAEEQTAIDDTIDMF
ncbi:hypothetical protein EKO04_004283 [Ascochyta lentis]|uniref:Uncharacterized protein n=1 Tax=Ascochyta lentis TaxID=205686 RepID=A0A8H7J712_9PLEO|nr:hypothetical protein EKO04_004283 [Ascochyta lentis]